MSHLLLHLSAVRTSVSKQLPSNEFSVSISNPDLAYTIGSLTCAKDLLSPTGVHFIGGENFMMHCGPDHDRIGRFQLTFVSARENLDRLLRKSSSSPTPLEEFLRKNLSQFLKADEKFLASFASQPIYNFSNVRISQYVVYAKKKAVPIVFVGDAAHCMTPFLGQGKKK